VDATMILFAVFGFLAVVLALEGVYNLWVSKHGAEARRINERLASLGGETFVEAAIERSERPVRMAGFQALIERTTVGERLTRWVRASGSSYGAGELILMSVGLGVFGTLLPGLMGRPAIFGPALGLVFAVAPWLRTARMRSKRIESFENQFPEALDLMCRAMRAGHALPTAIKLVGEELPKPLGRDFRILFDEMNYGVPIGEAMNRLAVRVPLPDVSYFVVAVLIQRESGGNLAEIMNNLSRLIRERLKLMARVRVLSSEGRLSAWILVVLPFALGGVITLVNPDFMRPLWTDPMGIAMLKVLLLMMFAGVLVLQRVIRIRV
jgi:tight adherence protein B